MPSKIPLAISFTGLANFLGVVGVIGSLIFVGLELRQTQRIAIAGQIQERAKMETDRIISYTAGNIQGQLLFNPSSFEFESLNDEEQSIARLAQAWKGVMHQNNYYQYQMGLFDERYWPQQVRRITNWHNTCELRQPIENYIEEFQEFLLSLEDRCVD